MNTQAVTQIANFLGVSPNQIKRCEEWASILFVQVQGGGYFLVPQARVESILERLESGESPDVIAQSLPIDEPPK